MALVVEDGTGLSNANGYISLALFRSYHDDRGNDHTSLTDTQIGQYIVLGADYIESQGPFLGRPISSGQSLSFPRVGINDELGVPTTGVPTDIQNANAEYAWQASLGNLIVDGGEYPGIVNRVSEKVGPLAEETEIIPSSTRNFRVADRLVSRYRVGGGSSAKWLVRS